MHVYNKRIYFELVWGEMGEGTGHDLETLTKLRNKLALFRLGSADHSTVGTIISANRGHSWADGAQTDLRSGRPNGGILCKCRPETSASPFPSHENQIAAQVVDARPTRSDCDKLMGYLRAGPVVVA